MSARNGTTPPLTVVPSQAAGIVRTVADLDPDTQCVWRVAKERLLSRVAERHHLVRQHAALLARYTADLGAGVWMTAGPMVALAGQIAELELSIRVIDEELTGETPDD